MTDVATALRQELDQLLAAPVLRAEDEPLGGVAAVVRVQARAAELLSAAVDHARDAGCTWQQIGDVLGVSRQAAFQRFGRPIDPRTGEAMAKTPLVGADGLAGRVVNDLAHGRWSAVTDRFDPTLAERLDVEGLAAAWAHLIGMAGAFENLGAAEVTRAADFTITNTSLEFEAGEFTARITFRDDSTIAGLFLLPAEGAR